jgi:hypothetical protein
MNEDIRLESGPGPRPDAPARRFVPMQIGGATVFVQETGEPVWIEEDDQIRPVGPRSPTEAFESAGEILRECVRVIGDGLESLAAKVRPDQITVEFSLSFEVKGKASLVPVFVTGESGAQTGLKVTAVWKRGDGKES